MAVAEADCTKKGSRPSLKASTSSVLAGSKPAAAAQSLKAVTGSSKKEAIRSSGLLTFDKSIQRLGFELDFSGVEPRIFNIDAGGEAHKRGIKTGAVIQKVNGTDTAGKDRDELMPLMQGRPLTLLVGKVVQAETLGDEELARKLQEE